MRWARVAVAGLLVLMVPIPAEARLREVSVGNYWFEDDQTGARNPLVVDEGDQIRFTIREATYPPHSVVIDEYGLDSGYLVLFQTYTTPPLEKPGRFELYCRAHRERGHKTTLIVKARASSAPSPSGSAAAPPPKRKPTQTTEATPSDDAPTEGPAAATTAPAAAQPSPPTSPEAFASVGVGEATDRRRSPPDADSLAGLMGHRFGGDAPWTTAVWLALIAMVPIGAAAAYAIRRERGRAGGHAFARRVLLSPEEHSADEGSSSFF